MIDLYTWSTPNGRKVSILLEELELPYRTFPVDITKDEQFAPGFLAISPNNKIPAIIDPDGPDGQPLHLFESGAILIYLAEKHDRFLPKEGRGRAEVLEWLMWQMGGFGPMLGQAHHFRRFAPEQVPYAVNRYSKEAERLYGVLEKRLTGRDFVAGDYSIADMAIYPWAQRHDWQGIDLATYPAIEAWRARMAVRPAVVKGMLIPA